MGEPVVYFIRHADRVKVGMTSDLAQRFSMINKRCDGEAVLIGAILGGYEIERTIHREFAAFASGGEWFELDPIVESSIAALIKRRGIKPDAAPPDDDAIEDEQENSDRKLVAEATAIIKRLIHDTMRTEDMNAKSALRHVSRMLGMSESRIFKLKYEPPPSLSAGTYLAIKKWSGDL
jgi:hypothetical protein